MKRRKSNFKSIIFTALACSVLNFSCSSKYLVNTNPEGAEVFYGKVSLGKTPLKMTPKELDGDDAGGALIRIEKSGYKRIWLWLPKSKRNFEISMNLNPFYMRGKNNTAANMEREISRIDLNRITHTLLDLQTSLLLSQNFKEEDITNLILSNPTLGSAHFLKAVALLSKNQKEEAINILKDAVKYSPKEFDFMALLNELNPLQSKTP